jgi:hypothetical protein
MFEIFQSYERLDGERTRWEKVQQRGKRRFYLQYIISFMPLPFILLGKLGEYILPGSNRMLVISISLAVSFLLCYTVTMLMWRRGMRLTHQAT